MLKLRWSGLVPVKVREEILKQIPKNVSPTCKRMIQRHLLKEKGY